MKSKRSNEPLFDASRIERALAEAAIKAIDLARATNVPLVICPHGEVEEISGEEAWRRYSEPLLRARG